MKKEEEVSWAARKEDTSMVAGKEDKKNLDGKQDKKLVHAQVLTFPFLFEFEIFLLM
jgi:hypothetical protein